MATKPERMEETKRWRIAYEKRCSHSCSLMVYHLRQLSQDFFKGEKDGDN